MSVNSSNCFGDKPEIAPFEMGRPRSVPRASVNNGDLAGATALMDGPDPWPQGMKRAFLHYSTRAAKVTSSLEPKRVSLNQRLS